MYRRLTAGLIAFLGLWAPLALASETEPKWSGLYLGAVVGRLWGDTRIGTDVGAVTSNSYFQYPANASSVNSVTSGRLPSDVGLAGVQFGYNTRMGGWVFGFEADYSAFGLRGSVGAREVPYPAAGSMPFKYSAGAEIEADWLATARGRVGFLPQPNLLIYATGGLAMANIRLTNFFSDNAPEQGVGGSRKDTIKRALTFGGGTEWMLSKAWSLKAEYLYVDFGSTVTSGSITCGPGGAAICTFFNVTPSPYSTSVNPSGHIARVGLNYRF